LTETDAGADPFLDILRKTNPGSCENEFAVRQCDPSRVLVLPAECSGLAACNGKPGLCH